MKKNGLVKEDACDQTKWRGVIETMPYKTRPTPSMGTILDPTCDDDKRQIMFGNMVNIALEKSTISGNRTFGNLACYLNIELVQN